MKPAPPAAVNSAGPSEPTSAASAPAEGAPGIEATPPPQQAQLDGPGLWRRAIELSESRQLRALLGQAEPGELSGDVARIRAGRAVAPMIEAKRAAVESLLAQAGGQRVRLEITSDAPAGTESKAPAAAQASAADEPETEHPLVRRAAELFGAKVVHIEPLERPQ